MFVPVVLFMHHSCNQYTTHDIHNGFSNIPCLIISLSWHLLPPPSEFIYAFIVYSTHLHSRCLLPEPAVKPPWYARVGNMVYASGSRDILHPAWKRDHRAFSSHHRSLMHDREIQACTRNICMVLLSMELPCPSTLPCTSYRYPTR